MFKKGFSLIELLIVVLIVGIVYTLGITNFNSLKEAKIKPSLLNLKNYLSSLKYEDKVELICLDRCRSCNIYIDGEINETKSVSFDSFLDSSVRVYKYTIFEGLQEKAKEIYFNSEGSSEEICFSYSLDKRGRGEQVFVEYKGKVYDFTNYLTKTTEFTSIDEAQESIQKELNELFR